ncbi:MAG: DUF4126 domain-containing protein [Phycisphaeraceae bacterium]|nr:DUF4126 domain-containing protein [Phycisphaeraceae bacterium]
MALLMGLGLSATCGFRVFVPLLGMSIATLAGHLEPASGFEWVGSWPALICFAVAAVLEIGGYYIPWLDNLLDAIATPAAVVAGTIVTASMTGEMSPLLRWLLAIIAGGGSAGAVQLATAFLRGSSTATTGGAANPVVSTGELGASVVGTVLAIVIPVLSILFVGCVMFMVLRLVRRKRRLEVVQGQANLPDSRD